jgi:hypothetical protein
MIGVGAWTAGYGSEGDVAHDVRLQVVRKRERSQAGSEGRTTSRHHVRYGTVVVARTTTCAARAGGRPAPGPKAS